MKELSEIDSRKIEEQANYCLNCKTKPCKNGCPLENDIPTFIKNIKEKEYKQAYATLRETTIMQSVCGRICPHMSQCMGNCVRGIKSVPVQIGTLEAFIGDKALQDNYEEEYIKKIKSNGKSVAIVGGGPAGLTCAAFLAQDGFNVTIYEKHNNLGGILSHGIPEFRLDKEALEGTIQKVLNLGVNVEYHKELGINITLEDLTQKYNAVFIAVGANIPYKMGVPGEELKGVYGGNTLLEKFDHPNYENKNVAVIGGGNVAMDCARTINKMGANKVTVIYRRAEEQMPAEKKEIADAKNEGVEFLFQTNLVKIHGSNKVEQIECVKTKLVPKEGEKRLVPVNIEDSNFKMEMDYVVMALGSSPEYKVVNKLGLELTESGYIKVDENYKTSMENVFAGGDIVGSKKTVAWAARNGRDVAQKIFQLLGDV